MGREESREKEAIRKAMRLLVSRDRSEQELRERLAREGYDPESVSYTHLDVYKRQDGIYPKDKPSYETAFIFLNREYEKHEVPEWGLRLNLGLKLEED